MEAIKFFKTHYNTLKIPVPSLHVVLGSGLSSEFDNISLDKNWETRGSVPFGNVPGLNPSSAPGHAGVFKYFFHKKLKKSVTFQLGRLHGYEGLTPRQVVLPLVAAFQAGTTNFLLTNAAGSLNKKFAVGSVMLIKDHVNMTGLNPLLGANPTGINGQALGARFPDMSNVYNLDMQKNLRSVLKKNKLKVNEGIYLGLLGPAYETPAEVKLYSSWGMGAVGMSTVWEAMALQHLRARLAGLSFISNMGCGLDKHPLRHEDVEAIGKKISKQLLESLFDFAEKELN